MGNLPTYSQFFTCIYDEKEPIGNLGRGTHYSVFRTAEWFDVKRSPLGKAQVHDFAVIWDEDHDERVIDAIEKIYMAGLLSPIQFIGERKGMLTVILAAIYYFGLSPSELDTYKAKINAISQDLDDCWPAELGFFHRQPEFSAQIDPDGIIQDSSERVITYLRNIDSLWTLGTKPYASANWGPVTKEPE